MRIRHNLRVLMAKRGIRSIRQLAEQSNLERSKLQHFSAYVHKKIDPELVAGLCKFFECKIEDLLYFVREEDGDDRGFPRKVS